MTIFFTSDTHFGHANIITYCRRPFASVEEMDETLVANWNARVGPDDTVWHLGDFALGRHAAMLARLQGRKILIRGNHDRDPRPADGWDAVHELRETTVEGRRIVLCHYPMRVWNGSHHGSWMLYGHAHGTLPDDPSLRSFDVGVDCHGFAPLSFADVGRIMGAKATSGGPS